MSKAILFLVIALFISVNIQNVKAQESVNVVNSVRLQEDVWEYKTLSDYDFESKLSDLGKASWELIGVVSRENRNPTLVFKRRIDSYRSYREAEEAKKPSEPKPVNLNKVEIIDADALELRQKNEALQRGQEQKIRQALASYKNASLKIEKLRSSSTTNGRIEIDGAITIDGSNALLKDGKYRASEAQKFLREKAIEIANQIGVQIHGEPFSTGGGVKNTLIPISLIVNYQGESKVIASGLLRGDYSDKPPSK